jgi:hypothetical protein
MLKSQTNRRLDWALAALFAAVAAVLAWAAFTAYHAEPDMLWRGVGSDRNGHFHTGALFALAFLDGDFTRISGLIRGSLLYPPLHGLTLGGVLAAGGVDPRLGTIPSLAAWVVMVATVFLIGRRMFADAMLGRFAGAVAAILALASPVPRYLANDVMLESMGAALTALSVLLYMRASEDLHSRLRWWLLAIALTALFYTKTNYWTLAVAGLVATALAANAAQLLRWLRAEPVGRRAGATLRWLLWQPLLWAFAVMAALTVYAYWTGVTEINPLGIRIRFSVPTLMAQTYAVLLAAIAIALFRYRVALTPLLGVPGWMLILWHALPVGAWFLLRGQLYYYIWSVGPAHRFGEHHDPYNAMLTYWQGFAEGFVVAPWMAILAVALALIATVQVTRFSQGARAPFFVVAVCTVAVLVHPNHQARFLTSFIPLFWVCAGAGAACVLDYMRLSTAMRTAAAVAAVVLLGGISLGMVPDGKAKIHAIQTPGPSEFDLSDVYLPAVGAARHIGVLAAHHDHFYTMTWLMTVRCRCPARIDDFGHGGPKLDGVFGRRVEAWMADTSASHLIAISNSYYPIDIAKLRAIAERSKRLDFVLERAVPSHGAIVAVWVRKQPQAQ